MANLSKLKIQKPIRVFPDEWKKLQARLIKDHLTFQRFIDIIIRSYTFGNNSIDILIKRHNDETEARKNDSKRRYSISEEQAEDILAMIESESPLNSGEK